MASCYRRSLEVAIEHGLKTIAFPAISTGVYRFPAARAAEIAVGTTADFLATEATITMVTYCSFGEASAAHHRDALAALGS